jgi:hypothetical protein
LSRRILLRGAQEKPEVRRLGKQKRRPLKIKNPKLRIKITGLRTPAGHAVEPAACQHRAAPVASLYWLVGFVVTTPVLVTNFWHVESLYSLTWSNVAAGTHALTAVATDNAGLSSTSAPVKITVLPPPQPKVEITNPENGKTFHNAPSNIELCAFERHFTNPVGQIQFWAGTTSGGGGDKFSVSLCGPEQCSAGGVHAQGRGHGQPQRDRDLRPGQHHRVHQPDTQLVLGALK